MELFALQHPWITALFVIFAMACVDNWVCALINRIRGNDDDAS